MTERGPQTTHRSTAKKDTTLKQYVVGVLASISAAAVLAVIVYVFGAIEAGPFLMITSGLVVGAIIQALPLGWRWRIALLAAAVATAALISSLLDESESDIFVVPTTTTTSSTTSTSTTSSTTSTLTRTNPDATEINAALLTVPDLNALVPEDSWQDWGELRNVPLIDPDNPVVCGQTVDNSGLIDRGFRTATGTPSYDYAGSILATFEGVSGARFVNDVKDLAAACPGWRINLSVGLAGVDESVAITVSSGSMQALNGVVPADVVIFRKGGVVGLVGADLHGDNRQALGVRNLAAKLADRI